MAEPQTYKNEQNARALASEYRSVKAGLDGLYERWTALQQELDKEQY